LSSSFAVFEGIISTKIRIIFGCCLTGLHTLPAGMTQSKRYL
jgi:hypothetical protein